MNSRLIAILVICTASLYSCTTKRTDPGFVDYTAKNAIKPYTKIGKACNYNLSVFAYEIGIPLGLRWGEATIENIVKEHGMTDVVTIENTSSLYPFLTKECIIVKGN